MLEFLSFYSMVAFFLYSSYNLKNANERENSKNNYNICALGRRLMMKKIIIKDILEVTKGQLIKGKENEICNQFSKDTRTIEKGDIYIGIRGEKFDGNIFWKQALKKGAKGIIVQDIDFSLEELEEFEDKIIILVEDTLKALYQIASFKRSLYDIPVIAITGSVGKTSTKDMVASVVSQKFKTLKTIGNNNNNIGMPFTILQLKEEEAMVLEMGMNHLGEIHLLSQIAKPNICIITNIGTSHIGNLGSRENILKAKLEILDGSQNPVIIVNNDNDLLHQWYEDNKDNKNILTYGIENKSFLQAKNINLEEESSTFDCNIKGQENEIKVSVGGEHFVLNSLCAILVGTVLKIENEKIKKGIETFELTKKRMDITNLSNGIKVINDAYNASFESMQATLKNMSIYSKTRKIAILGDMFELGEFAEELHRKVGREVVKRNIDILICSGENAKYIAEEAKKQGMLPEQIYILTREEILPMLKQIVRPNDVILFKASNGMKFFELAEQAKAMLK